MLVVPSRRSFLTGLGLLIAAPAIVRAASLMPVNARLIVPDPAIGMIRANIGPIPPGWVECDGRWMIKRAHSDLYRVVGGTYGETGHQFFLPDLRAKSQQECIGRYIINAGDQGAAHRASIASMTNSAAHYEADIRDGLIDPQFLIFHKEV